MSESDEVKFTCSVCGKEFEPDPNTMVECGFEVVREATDEEVENLLSKSELEEATPEELHYMSLTQDMKEAMMRGEDVTTAACICLECQDELAKDGHFD